MARLRSWWIVRYDPHGGVGPPVWMGKETPTTRQRGILHPTVREQGRARMFRSEAAAAQAVAARPRAARAVIEKVLR